MSRDLRLLTKVAFLSGLLLYCYSPGENGWVLSLSGNRFFLSPDTELTLAPFLAPELLEFFLYFSISFPACGASCCAEHRQPSNLVFLENFKQIFTFSMSSLLK